MNDNAFGLKGVYYFYIITHGIFKLREEIPLYFDMVSHFSVGYHVITGQGMFSE